VVSILVCQSQSSSSAGFFEVNNAVGYILNSLKVVKVPGTTWAALLAERSPQNCPAKSSMIERVVFLIGILVKGLLCEHFWICCISVVELPSRSMFWRYTSLDRCKLSIFVRPKVAGKGNQSGLEFQSLIQRYKDFCRTLLLPRQGVSEKIVVPVNSSTALKPRTQRYLEGQERVTNTPSTSEKALSSPSIPLPSLSISSISTPSAD
jgi:hypothetical protein